MSSKAVIFIPEKKWRLFFEYSIKKREGRQNSLLRELKQEPDSEASQLSILEWALLSPGLRQKRPEENQGRRGKIPREEESTARWSV